MRRLCVSVLAAVVVGLGLFGIATAAGGSSGDPAQVAHWQAQLARDSAIPQEGYLQLDANHNVVGNDWWGPCHPSPSFVHTFDCPEAGTAAAEAFGLQIRADVAHDRAMLAAAEAALGG